MQPHVTPQHIIDYYETCESDYRLVWHLKENLAMHYGFWEKDTKRLRQALKQMNEQVMNLAAVQAGQLALDAGCGCGGSAFHAAKTYGCQVKGVTLSPKQVSAANIKAQQHQLSHLVDFSVQDYTQTNFPDNHFDVVWAIESVCHAHEKAAFLREAYRVLKPGGTLVVADFFRTKNNFSTDEEKLLANWANTWAVPDFEYVGAFQEKSVTVGFKNTLVQDITRNIWPSARRLYVYFFPGVLCHGVLSLMGRRNRIHRANVWSTYYQYAALKKGLWQYFLVKATK